MSIQTDILTYLEEEGTPLLSNDLKTSHMSWIMASGLIINAAIGAGLLNIAKSFDEAGGIAVSSIIHGAVILVVLGAYAILFVCSDHTTPSYEEFVLKKCGKFWKKVASICIILYSYGLSITYFIIIGDQLNQILTLIAGEDYCSHWYLRRDVMIIITSVVIIFPLCFANSMKFLQIPSMLGVLAIIYVIFLVPVKYFILKPEHVEVKTGPDSWTDVFLVLPTLCFAYQAHVNAVPAFAALKSRGDCIKATLGSTIILVLSYCFVAICGYLTFGTKIQPDILLSYNVTEAPVITAVGMVAIKTYAAYPVNIYCGRTAIESFMSANPTSSLKRRIIIVCLWFFSTLAGAVFLPNISLAIHYLGALAASFIFIFPGLSLFFHIQENWISSRHKILSISIAIFYVALGVFVTAITLVQSVMNDIKPSETKNGTSQC